MPWPKGDADDGSVGIPGDSADFRFDATFFLGAFGEGQRERLDEWIARFIDLPIRNPLIESANGRVVSQKTRHFRLVFAQELDESYARQKRKYLLTIYMYL